jgi:dihydrodipicolinate synthase/N-acetylneuraminate lyase
MGKCFLLGLSALAVGFGGGRSGMSCFVTNEVSAWNEASTEKRRAPSARDAHTTSLQLSSRHIVEIAKHELDTPTMTT